MTDEDKLRKFADKLDVIGYSCMSKEDQGFYVAAMFEKILEIMRLNLNREQRLSLLIKLLNEENRDG